VPSAPDELTVAIGETVRVIEVFDDEWALVENSSGKRGFIPQLSFGADELARMSTPDMTRRSSRSISVETGSIA